MSAAVPDDMMAMVIPRLYAVTTHCRPASPTLKSDWMAGNATFTISASMKIMKRPRLVAVRVKRCVLVIGAQKFLVDKSYGPAADGFLSLFSTPLSFTEYLSHS